MGGWLARALRRLLPHKELGWPEINEEFTRYTLLKTPLFGVYLHRLKAPRWHRSCHDHPWHFWALILWGGYYERLGGRLFYRRAGRLMYRPAESTHNVATAPGGAANWSLILVSRKCRPWRFRGELPHTCEGAREG